MIPQCMFSNFPDYIRAQCSDSCFGPSSSGLGLFLLNESAWTISLRTRKLTRSKLDVAVHPSIQSFDLDLVEMVCSDTLNFHIGVLAG